MSAPSDDRHLPVMLAEVMAALAPVPGGIYVDGTFGAGGYTRAILEAGASVIAIDRDPTAIAAGAALAAASAGRLTLVEGRFSDLAAIAADAGHARVDGVVLDVGVSSMQLDDPARGFSFRFDGPLDMRMGDDGPSAATWSTASSRATSPASSPSLARRSGPAPSPWPSPGRARRGRSAAPGAGSSSQGPPPPAPSSAG